MTQGQSTYLRLGVSEQRGSRVIDADRIPNFSWAEIIIRRGWDCTWIDLLNPTNRICHLVPGASSCRRARTGIDRPDERPVTRRNGALAAVRLGLRRKPFDPPVSNTN